MGIFLNAKVKRRDFYNWMIQKYLDAGWVNVSSSLAVDGHVLNSYGESGGNDLFLQFGTGGLDTNPSNKGIIGRLPKTYTPGAPGTGGTWEKAGAWVNLRLTEPVAIALDAVMSVWYLVNKDFGAFLVEGHTVYNGTACFLFAGLPKTIKPEDRSSGVMLVSNGFFDRVTYGTALITDDPYNVRTYFYEVPLLNNLPPITKTRYTFDKRFCCPVMFGDADGYRAQLDDGIVLINDITGNLLYTINGNPYRLFYMPGSASYGNAFDGYAIGIRVG